MEAAGSNPAPSTTREPRRFKQNVEGRILNVVWELKKNGYADATIRGYSKRLRFLSRFTDLEHPDSVKAFIAVQEKWSNVYKESVVNAYTHYVKQYDLIWEKPVYKRPQRLPNVPTAE